MQLAQTKQRVLKETSNGASRPEGDHGNAATDSAVGTAPPSIPVQLPFFIVLLRRAVLTRLPLHSSTRHHICILMLAADSLLVWLVPVYVGPCWTAPGLVAARAGLADYYTAAELASSPTAACLQYMHAPAGPLAQHKLDGSSRAARPDAKRCQEMISKAKETNVINWAETSTGAHGTGSHFTVTQERGYTLPTLQRNCKPT